MNDDTKRAMMTVTDGVLGAAVLLAGGVYGGNWLDQQLHTAPWLSMGLALLGGGLGLARMVIKAQQIGANSPAPKASEGATRATAHTTPSEVSDTGLRQKRPFEDLDDEEN